MNQANAEKLGDASFVGQTIEEWRGGAEPNARQVLEARPTLLRHQSLAIDLAYEEYCLRIGNGEVLAVDSFCDDFPPIREPLERQLELHHLLEEEPDVLDGMLKDRWPVIGQEFLGSVIEGQIGAGSFARVFKARQVALGDRRVVLKVAAHGLDEAGVLGRLNHPNIVPIFSVDQDPSSGLVSICMPYLGEDTLEDLASSNRFGRTPEERANNPDLVRVFCQLADALAHSHAHGILHLDIKPSNVLCTSAGQAMLLDFNLSFDQIAGTRRFGGTLPYMAPEQLKLVAAGDALSVSSTESNSTTVSGKADLYSLGVMAFEIVYGHHPFCVEAADGISSKVASEMLALQQTAELPGKVDGVVVSEVIDKCLAFTASDRPGAAHLAEQLRRCIEPQTESRRPAPVAGIGIAMTFVGLAVIIFSSWLFFADRQPSEHDLAIRHAQKGDYKLAIINQTAAVRQSKRLEDIVFLAQLCARADYPADGIFWYEQAISKKPRDADLRNNLGYCYLKMERFDKACHAFEVALQLDDSHVDARRNLAIAEFERWSKTRHGVPERAAAQIDKILVSSRSPQTLVDASAVYSCFSVEQAQSFFDEAVKLGVSPNVARENPLLAQITVPVSRRPDGLFLQPMVARMVVK